jgi:hypothetical protein
MAPRVEAPTFFIPVPDLYYNEAWQLHEVWPQFKENEKVQCRSFAAVFEERSDAEEYLRARNGGTVFCVSAADEESKLVAYQIFDKKEKDKPLFMQPDLIGKVLCVDKLSHSVEIQLETGYLPLFEDLFPTRTAEEMCQAAKRMREAAKKDEEKREVYSLFCKAAEYGSKEARFRKAKCQLDGFGTKKEKTSGVIRDILDSVKDMEVSESNVDAFIFVGDMHMKGDYGQEKDLRAALECFEKAKSLSTEAENRVNEINTTLKTPKDQKDVKRIRRQSVICRHDDPIGLVNDGLQEYYGIGGLPNGAKAAELFKRAGEEFGSPEGMNNCAVCYIQGGGVRKDRPQEGRGESN